MVTSRRQNIKGCLTLSSIALGEVLAGYFARHRYSTNGPLHRRLVTLHGVQFGSPPTWLFPTKLQLIADQIGDAVGSADALLAQNTLFPIFSFFLSADEKRALQHFHYFGPNKNWDIRTILSSLQFRNCEWQTAICQSCLREDIAIDGRHFIRRDFVMPGLRFCIKHEETVRSLCQHCFGGFDGSHSSVISILNCRCQLMLPKAKETSVELDHEFDLAQAINCLLNSDHLRHISRERMMSAVTKRAAAIGLTKNGKVQRPIYRELICDTRHTLLLGRNNFPNCESRLISEVLVGKIPLRHPVHFILLLRMLFGNWEEAKTALSLEHDLAESINFPYLIRQPVPRPIKKASSSRDKQPQGTLSALEVEKNLYLYKRLLKHNPKSTHTELLKQLPDRVQRSFALYRVRDIHKSVFPERLGPAYYRALDIPLANHIRHSFKVLSEAGYQGCISKALLLKHSKAKATWKKFEQYATFAPIALLECSETIKDSRRRILKDHVRNGNISTIPKSDVAQVDALDDKSIRQALYSIREKQ